MNLAVYSCGGFAREITPMAREEIERVDSHADIVWVDDNPSLTGKVVNGIKVISFADLTSPEHCTRKVSVAIADPMTFRMMKSQSRRAPYFAPIP